MTRWPCFDRLFLRLSWKLRDRPFSENLAKAWDLAEVMNGNDSVPLMASSSLNFSRDMAESEADALRASSSSTLYATGIAQFVIVSPGSSLVINRSDL